MARSQRVAAVLAQLGDHEGGHEGHRGGEECCRQNCDGHDGGREAREIESTIFHLRIQAAEWGPCINSAHMRVPISTNIFIWSESVSEDRQLKVSFVIFASSQAALASMDWCS